jgi:hypothetical protein
MILLIGWLGTALILGAYFVLKMDWLSHYSIFLVLANLFGSLGIAIAAFFGGLWSVVALQVAWAAITIFGALKAWKKWREHA